MTKNIIARVDRNLARRLREARREVGLSTRKVSECLPRRVAVSHSAIANYEKGVTLPPIDILAALADLYKRPLNWFLESRETISNFRYRNLGGRVPLADQRQFEALAGKWIDAYFNLEKHLKARRPKEIRLPTGANDGLSPDELAIKVRQDVLNLDDNEPVQNIVDVLESFSAWAMEIKASFGVDSAAARHGNEFIVVLNPDVANESVRMNGAHELAHLLYDDYKGHDGWNESEVEKRAYAFASPFLLPESQLKAAFEGKSFLRLIQYKEKFGISLAAMIFAAERDGIINTTASRWLRTEMLRRGWKQNEPGYVWRDRAIGFEMMLESAIQTKTLSWEDAERITGIREKELRQRLEGVMLIGVGLSKGADHEPAPTLKFTRGTTEGTT